MSFLAFLVSGAWIPDFDSLLVELLGFHIAPNKKFPAFRNLDSLTWRKEKKKVYILPAISAGPRNHSTTGIAHADVPAIVSEEPVI